MADNDYNSVVPIEGLGNVLGVSPTEQKEQEQQHRKTPSKSRPPHAKPDQDKQSQTEHPQDNHDGNHLIDYRA
jgi:hypothetical protein